MITQGVGSEPFHLRFKIQVPEYEDINFPSYIGVNDPVQGQTDILLDPLFSLDSDAWQYLEISKGLTDESVYYFNQEYIGLHSFTHQIPDGILDHGTSYLLFVDVNDHGNTWLGSMTRISFSTAGKICVGDFDQDGDVDGKDLYLFISAFGSTSGDPDYNPDMDFNGDSAIGPLDIEDIGMDFGNQGCEVPW